MNIINKLTEMNDGMDTGLTFAASSGPEACSVSNEVEMGGKLNSRGGDGVRDGVRSRGGDLAGGKA